MFFTYILYSEKTLRFYIGSTGNIDDRIKRHNQGRSTYTKTGIPWKLVYTEPFKTKAEAYQREMELKSWKSHERILKLIENSNTK
ncbi:MAG: GIY-YIG nuclease family protein [Bacteroidales bacterium]|nr:GIY-YIG nuclease family protein [Bacteroidales bacterium]MDD2796968.1 GIY-YIG nuclease family protein [Bacteroidales bacterium]